MIRKKKTIDQKPAWKKNLDQKRQARMGELLVRLITVVVFIFIVLVVFSIWKSLRKSAWDGKHQLNFVVQGKKVVVYSFHPEEDLLNILIFNPDTYIPAAQGFGDYPIANIVKLGNQEKINGSNLLSLSLQQFLAVPIDGTILINDSQEINNTDLFNKTNLILIYLCLFRQKCQTNFTNWDLLRMGLNFSRMNSGQIRLLDFSQTQAIVRETLPDGSTILKPDYLKIDKLSLELMGDLTALEENTTISLINSTLTSGLANNFGRLVKNLGLKLIHTADGQENVKTSVIYYKDDQVKKSYTLKRLVTTFQLKKVEKNDGMEEDLQFVLGEDLSRPY